MVRPEKVAMPATAVCVAVPDSVPPPALFPMASVTFAANPVAVLPKLSRAVTWIAGVIAEPAGEVRSEEHTSELQSRGHLVCRLLLEKKKKQEVVACVAWVLWGVRGVRWR